MTFCVSVCGCLLILCVDIHRAFRTLWNIDREISSIGDYGQYVITLIYLCGYVLLYLLVVCITILFPRSVFSFMFHVK